MPRQHSPSADEMMAIARAAFEALPDEMRRAAARVAIRIEEFAAPDVLADFDITDPYQLTGLYHGVSLIHESVTFPSLEEPVIFLYRQPILAEWRSRPDVGFEELVAHVFIHELGHHFGYSDEEMHEIAGH